MASLSPTLRTEIDKRLRATRDDLMSHARARLEESDEPAAVSLLAYMAQNDDMPTADMLGDDELRLLGHEFDEVHAIDNAIARLHVGTYGTCLVCGMRIADERLLAMPTVQYCIDCQHLVEKQDHIAPGPSM
jgi:RNA polymerase-binding transcription factor DksA